MDSVANHAVCLLLTQPASYRWFGMGIPPVLLEIRHLAGLRIDGNEVEISRQAEAGHDPASITGDSDLKQTLFFAAIFHTDLYTKKRASRRTRRQINKNSLNVNWFALKRKR
jgi:hypothetical protein